MSVHFEVSKNFLVSCQKRKNRHNAQDYVIAHYRELPFPDGENIEVWNAEEKLKIVPNCRIRSWRIPDGMEEFCLKIGEPQMDELRLSKEETRYGIMVLMITTTMNTREQVDGYFLVTKKPGEEPMLTLLIKVGRYNFTESFYPCREAYLIWCRLMQLTMQSTTVTVKSGQRELKPASVREPATKASHQQTRAGKPIPIMLTGGVRMIRTYQPAQGDPIRHYERHTESWMVRGHVRHYRSGKTVFIQPFRKGKKEKTNQTTETSRVYRVAEKEETT